MPSPRAVRLLLALAAISFLGAGCWDRREIDELALVSTVAVDREKGQTVVTAEFFRPAALSQQTGSGAGVTMTGRQSHLAVGRGPTVFRAIEDIGVKLPREVRWAHANNILVGEEMARRGLRELLDFWDRDPEARRSTHLLLAWGPAGEIMRRAQSAFELDLGREIAGLEQAAPQTGYGYIPTVHTVIEDLAGESRATFLPVLVLSPTNVPPPAVSGSGGGGGPRGAAEPAPPPVVLTARLYGTGLFLGDRLVGRLNPRQTRGLIWVLGAVREAV
ncbi:MAG: Ger(x)C family spore germination protein, partial [Moorellales bacterium]